MLKACSILIASMILIQGVNFNFGDLVQLDELIEHAQFHKEEYGDNFLVFLSKHYGELKAEHSEKHQEEAPDHEQLPLNQQLSPLLILSPFIIDHQLHADLTVDFPNGNENLFHYSFSNSSLFDLGVFEPPRLS